MCIVEITCNNCLSKHAIVSHDGLMFDEDGNVLTRLDYCKYCIE